MQKQGINFSSEVPLRICRAPSLRVGVDALEYWCIINKIPDQMANIDGPSLTAEIVVVLLSDKIEAGAESVAANILGELIAVIVAVFNKDRGCGRALWRSPAKAVETVTLNLDARNAEVDVLTRGNLIEVETGEIDAELVDHRRGESVDKGNRLNLVKGLLTQVSLGSAAAGAIGTSIIESCEVGAVSELVVSSDVIQSPVVLVPALVLRRRKRHVLNVGSRGIKSSADETRAD